MRAPDRDTKLVATDLGTCFTANVVDGARGDAEDDPDGDGGEDAAGGAVTDVAGVDGKPAAAAAAAAAAAGSSVPGDDASTR